MSGSGSDNGHSGQRIKKLNWVHNFVGYVLKYISPFIHPQWVVFVALMPLLWLFHQSQSILSLLVNIIAIPLLAVCILPLSILSLIFGEGVFTSILNWILTIGFDSLNILATQTSWLIFKPSGIWLFSLIFLGFSVLMFKGFPFKRLSLVLLCIIYFLPLQKTENKFVVLDVGQGLSIMGVVTLKSNSNKNQTSWVYDTGAKFRSGFSLGEAVVAQNILAISSKKLDLLFIFYK